MTDNTCFLTHDSSIVGNIIHHYGPCAYIDIIAYPYSAQDDGTSPDSHIIAYHGDTSPLYANSDTMIHCAVAPYTCSPIDYRGIAVYRAKALCYMPRQPHGTNLRQEYVKEMPCSPYAHIEDITKLRLIYQRTAQRPYKQAATNGIVPISRPRQNILVYHTALTSAQYIAYNMRYDSWHIKPNLQPVHIHHSAHIIITN